MREESEGREGERTKLGLEGVRFLYYRCPGCGFADIFVDVLPLEGEAEEAFRRRRAELEQTVRQLHADGVAVVVAETPDAAGPEQPALASSTVEEWCPFRRKVGPAHARRREDWLPLPARSCPVATYRSGNTATSGIKH